MNNYGISYNGVHVFAGLLRGKMIDLDRVGGIEVMVVRELDFQGRLLEILVGLSMKESLTFLILRTLEEIMMRMNGSQ